MIILGIETSCDETAAAVLRKDGDRIQILSNIVASSASLQAKYGGIIPEQAAREQIKSIIPVIEEALVQAFPEPSPLRFPLYASKIDTIAVTYGPGLIGSLLVGVETAKTLSLVWNKPIIPVNHLLGHFWANWISQSSAISRQPSVVSHQSPEKTSLKADSEATPEAGEAILIAESSLPQFPCIGLLVSGGHTDLVLFKDEQNYEYLGGTRDDAAGECFDKCARLLGLPYPGGPAIAQSAMEFKIQNLKFKIELPRPLLRDKTFDFSFSGLKTATSREVDRLKKLGQFNNETIKQLSFEIQNAIIDVLAEKTVRAAKKYKVEHIMIAGGVAANQKLKEGLGSRVKGLGLNIKLYIPPANLCTDNGAMIAARGFFQEAINPLELQAEPGLGLNS